jgi:hypothetical protein
MSGNSVESEMHVHVYALTMSIAQVICFTHGLLDALFSLFDFELAPLNLLTILLS